MSTHRRRAERRAARLQSFLQTKCFICVDDPEAGIPSTMLPCCLKYAHETCLLECFTHAWRRMPHYRPSCPHCRQLLVFYNKTENRPYVPAGSFAFAFEQIHYGISQADIIAAAVERYERPPPPVRPPGFSWAAIRREWEAQRPR